MKYVCLVLALFVASASCQGGPKNRRGPPPPPPSADPGAGAGAGVDPMEPSPVVTLTQPSGRPSAQPQGASQAASQPASPAQQQASAATGGVPVSQAASPQYTTSKRAQGCSPGCYSDEICAEMGRSYCQQGGMCNVCIKMKSIKFPASALSGIFQQSAPQPAVSPVVPAVTAPLGQPLGQPVQGGQGGFGYSAYQDPNAFSYSAQQPSSSLDPYSSFYTRQQPQRQEAPRQSYYNYYNQPQQQQYNPPSANMMSNNMFPFLFMGDFMGGLFGM